MLLQKYVSPSTARRVLGTSRLRSSPLSSFNDPFEGQVIALNGEIDHSLLADEFGRQVKEMAAAGEKVPLPTEEESKHGSPVGALVSLYQHGYLGEISNDDFMRLLREYISRLKLTPQPSGATQRIHTRLADFIYVLCFSANDQSLLMWSHYADHHRGAILTFDNQRSPSLLNRVEPVRYLQSFPQHDDLSGTVSSHLGRPVNVKEWTDNTLLTKSKEWTYEQEYRVLVRVGERDEDALVQIPTECLVSVVLGCRMSESETSELATLTAERFPHAIVSKAVRDPRDFKLNYQRMPK